MESLGRIRRIGDLDVPPSERERAAGRSHRPARAAPTHATVHTSPCVDTARGCSFVLVPPRMQPMSQAEVDAGEARQWLMQRGWSLDEVLSLEQSVRSKGSDFNTRLLAGLGEGGVDELRTQLSTATATPVAHPAPAAADDDLECFLDGIGKGTHKSDKNPVQRQPFSRPGRDGKWIDMKKPRRPMCESCTSTIRKHYTGTTNSPELVAAFVHEVEVYKCKSCGEWNRGATAVAASNLACTVCGWTAGRKKKGKAYPEGNANPAASSSIAKMLRTPAGMRVPHFFVP